MITRLFSEQIGFFSVPPFHGIHGASVTESLLGQVMVVEPDVAKQRGLQVLCAIVSPSSQHLGDTAIETLDHAVGLRRPGLGQTVLLPQGVAELVELVLATRLAVLGAEQAVGELLAVVGQEPGDLDRAGLVQGMQKGPRLKPRSCWT